LAFAALYNISLKLKRMVGNTYSQKKLKSWMTLEAPVIGF
jgi:hypothetical protein